MLIMMLSPFSAKAQEIDFFFKLVPLRDDWGDLTSLQKDPLLKQSLSTNYSNIEIEMYDKKNGYLSLNGNNGQLEMCYWNITGDDDTVR